MPQRQSHRAPPPDAAAPLPPGRMRWRLGVAYAIPAAALLALRALSDDQRWFSLPVHTAIEMLGFFSGSLLAVMLLILFLYDRRRYANPWAICALSTMSLLDGFHGLSSYNQAFVWLHSLATFCGGVFMAASVSRRFIPTRKALAWLALVTLAALIIGVPALIWPELAPRVQAAGRYTLLTQCLNVGGGLGFLFAAGVCQRAIRGRARPHAWSFSVFCALFGIAGVMFVLSNSWGLNWWGLHAVRLLGYLLVIAEIVMVFVRGREELVRINAQLDQRVAARTAELSQALSHLQQTQHELVQVEKLASLGSMVAGISHELNTPLGVAVTILSVAAERLRQLLGHLAGGTLKRTTLQEGLAELDESMRLLQRSVSRAAKLVASFKQIAVDQTSERRREFDVRQSVDDLVASLRPNWKHRDVRVVNAIAPGIVCHSLPGHIGQIVGNLLQNAVLHAFEGRAGGRITIDCRPAGDALEIRVSDDGVGMPADVLGRIFEPFFTTRLGTGGSGLGLAIAHRIATTILGGELKADSVPGRGTCFVLKIPLHASPAAPSL
ncbi:hypothetical protein BKK81_24330 [Cupriavidus sp. USMAHM13]|uniref:ATP-binding protein n=1 Tax=Cupriavidus sp. USMAHM13 TaxID=1389192 RepID=UPI0008A6B920|nr:ATP-binding protein [Cupriavidus sp. USMAHM13]AOZ02391.1 hypothetical protein BKK81_24330 [Cupriavidus sp. USMAHM13]